jgi:hypothetical protein
MVVRWASFSFLLIVNVLRAAVPCENAPAYSPCEMAFEAPAGHPNPYDDVELQAEFRSPRFRTFLMPAFWAGGRKLIVRFTPTEAGAWTYKITSNIASLESKGGFTAAESDAPGYVKPANVHHWATENKQPHLWMAYALERFNTLPSAEFDRALEAAAASKFTHLRGAILADGAYDSAHRPNTAFFDEMDRRVLATHAKRITSDLMFAANPEVIAKLFPDWQSRRRFVRYVVARYASLNVTWQGVEEFEGHSNARAVLKDIGMALKELDPYQHPRSTNARFTSAPFLTDGWMDFIIERADDDQIGAVEHQFYTVPFVGVTNAKRIWNATMNGQYPMIEGRYEREPRLWFDFIADTRHWELEPYFDVDAARAVALEDTEYIVLVEQPGPIELSVEKHGYDISWFNPSTGETVEQKKYKGEHFTGQAPNAGHPWVLLVAREGRKESMLRSYKFESRYVPVQEIESSTQKVPFDIAAPPGDTISASAAIPFAIKVKRETRAMRSVMYLWTGEVPADGYGFRVLATGAKGTFRIPPDLIERLPAVLSIRVSAINANGKAYLVDKVYQVTK